MNGKLDMQFINDSIKSKTNIFHEMTRIQQALKPYRAMIGDNEPAESTTSCVQTKIDILCKQYYTEFVEQKKEAPNSEKRITEIVAIDNLNFEDIYMRKIKQIKNPKIAEFNYKVIHLILPCNRNLQKWGKSETDLCEICGVMEDIKHMLFQCQHAQHIWRFVSKSLKFDVSLENIFLGTNNNIITYIISIMSYLIYKEWLISRNDQSPRVWQTTLSFLNRELKFRCAVFETVGNNDMKNIIRILLQDLDRSSHKDQ